MALSRTYTFALCFLVISCVFVDQVEGRRKILRGRKTINRTYYKQAAIPAWAIIVIVGVVELILGGAIYVLLNKYYIGDLSSRENTRYAPVQKQQQSSA